MLNPFTEMESIWTTRNGKNKFEMSSAQYQYYTFIYTFIYEEHFLLFLSTTIS